MQKLTNHTPGENNTMESPQHDFHSSVDTSRPFRSVKEAVAIFGERILVGEIYSSSSSVSSPMPNSHVSAYNIAPIQETTLKVQDDSNDSHVSATSCNVSPMQDTTPQAQNDNDDIVDAIKRVEAELEETKAELRLLREREQETEVAVASLNAELHKNMSRLAAVEAVKAATAVEAAKAATAVAAAAGGGNNRSNHVERDQEERWRKELKRRMEKNPTLAQILSLGLGEKDIEKKMVMKKKPIVPLVGDLLFSKKKVSTTRASATTKYG